MKSKQPVDPELVPMLGYMLSLMPDIPAHEGKYSADVGSSIKGDDQAAAGARPPVFHDYGGRMPGPRPTGCACRAGARQCSRALKRHHTFSEQI